MFSPRLLNEPISLSEVQVIFPPSIDFSYNIYQLFKFYMFILKKARLSLNNSIIIKRKLI